MATQQADVLPAEGRTLSTIPPTTGTGTAVALRPQPTDVIDRLIRQAKTIDATKINALIDAHVRIMAINAEAEFNTAFSDLQGEIPVIDETGKIDVLDKFTGAVRRSQSFASKADIMRVLTPLNRQYGFSVRFEHEDLPNNQMKIIGVLAHRSGHSVKDSFTGPRDESGQKSVIQSMGSTRSFGERYVLRSLYNLTSEVAADLNGYAPEDVRPSGSGLTPPRPGLTPQRPYDNRLITVGTKDKPGQRERLWAIVKNAGRTKAEFTQWLFEQHGYTSSKQITRGDYDAVIEAVQAPGPMVVSTRQPGEEG